MFQNVGTIVSPSLTRERTCTFATLHIKIGKLSGVYVSPENARKRAAIIRRVVVANGEHAHMQPENER